jgi:1,5-anhydro-D-fructose reductase (1,5-anhydro-D-mannitol-forming)
MALNVAECESMIRTAEKAGVVLGVAYMMPFHSSHQIVKRLLDERLLGRISLVKSDYLISLPYFQGSSFSTNQFRLIKALGGGVIMDLGVHCINTIRYLLGSEVQSVSSLYGALRFECDAEDTAVLLLHFDNGALGVLSLSFATQWGRNGIEFYGERGALISEQSLSQVPEAIVRSCVDGKWTEYATELLNPYLGEIEHFTECIRTGAKPITSGELGMVDIRIVEAAMESMRRGVHVEV